MKRILYFALAVSIMLSAPSWALTGGAPATGAMKASALAIVLTASGSGTSADPMTRIETIADEFLTDSRKTLTEAKTGNGSRAYLKAVRAIYVKLLGGEMSTCYEFRSTATRTRCERVKTKVETAVKNIDASCARLRVACQ